MLLPAFTGAKSFPRGPGKQQIGAIQALPDAHELSFFCQSRYVKEVAGRSRVSKPRHLPGWAGRELKERAEAAALKDGAIELQESAMQGARAARGSFRHSIQIEDEGSNPGARGGFVGRVGRLIEPRHQLPGESGRFRC